MWHMGKWSAKLYVYCNVLCIYVYDGGSGELDGNRPRIRLPAIVDCAREMGMGGEVG